mmetsp:Transcript_97379/g.135340  ORF Transcript_97379/g.135340 Transcript_97379/m.135340 type:complete len:95 (+) Transcript_97379:583-867(+)
MHTRFHLPKTHKPCHLQLSEKSVMQRHLCSNAIVQTQLQSQGMFSAVVVEEEMVRDKKSRNLGSSYCTRDIQDCIDMFGFACKLGCIHKRGNYH